MLLRPLAAAALALPAVILAAPALAATVAEGGGAFAIAPTDLPEAVILSFPEATSDFASEASGPLSSADALAETGVATGGVSAQARAEATPSGEAGRAEARAFATTRFTLENPTKAPLTVTAVLSYELLASVAVDDPARDAAFASTSLELRTNGETLLFEEAVREAGLPGREWIDEVFDPVFLILPGGTTEVFVRLETQANARDASPAPIPLPAGLPLLLAGLGGLGLLRRRRAASRAAETLPRGSRTGAADRSPVPGEWNAPPDGPPVRKPASSARRCET